MTNEPLSEAVTAERPGEDLDLVRRAVGGEPDAVQALVRRLVCVTRILTQMNSRSGGPLRPHELDDLGQDVLVALWQKLESYSGEGVLEAFAYRFCHFEWMTFLRKRRRGTLLLEDLSPGQESEQMIQESSPLSEYESLYRGLEELGPPEAEIIRLKHFEHLTFEGIARRMSEPVNTVKTRYYRGVRFLHRVLSRSGEGTGGLE